MAISDILVTDGKSPNAGEKIALSGGCPMRCIPTPNIFFQNMTEDGWIPSQFGKDIFGEAPYILAPIGILLFLALIPIGVSQASWDMCLEAYGPVSKTAVSVEGGGPSATQATKALATKSLNTFSSFLLLFSTIWHVSQDRAMPGARTPQFVCFRLFMLLTVPAVTVWATLSLDYSEEGLFAILLSLAAHMMDVVKLVFGDTQLRIETWG